MMQKKQILKIFCGYSCFGTLIIIPTVENNTDSAEVAGANKYFIALHFSNEYFEEFISFCQLRECGWQEKQRLFLKSEDLNDDKTQATNSLRLNLPPLI